MKALRVNCGWSVSVFVGVAFLGLEAKASAIQPEDCLNMAGQRAIANKPGISFEMDKKPWSEVFVWLVEKLDLPLAAGCSLKGTFTFIGPKGRSYTLPRIVDILNEALLAKGLVIIRGERCLLIVPVSEARSRAGP
jgi:hypothetical protein